MKEHLKVIVGAAIGGAIGHFIVGWIAQQGFYAMILPGGLLGFGAAFGRNRSVLLAGLCGISALALGLFTEWRFFPFVADGSFEFFLAHLTDLQPITLIMIAVGGLIGFWVPYSRIDRT